MTALASWLLVPLGLLALAACDGAKASRSDARPAASSSASVERPTMPAPVADAASIEAGPAGPDAAVSREERERVVLALLAGGEPANRLPRAAVDPGHDFDPAQRDRVAPPWRPPVLKMIGTTVAGPLPTAVIDRIVRQSTRSRVDQAAFAS